MDRIDRIEQQYIELRRELGEVEGQVELLADHNTHLLDQRDQLLEMLERVLDAYSTSAGRTALVISAEDLINDIYNEKWIHLLGTAPPGVDFDHIEETPHPNPPPAGWPGIRRQNGK
jgi:regulator of replication initiation timing